MPTFISHVPVDFHKLLQDCAVTASTFGRKASRVVEMTIDIPIVLVIRVLGSEERRTYRARKVFHMELLVWEKQVCKQVKVKLDGLDGLHAVI
jgi:hypothetical protein